MRIAWNQNSRILTRILNHLYLSLKNHLYLSLKNHLYLSLKNHLYLSLNHLHPAVEDLGEDLVEDVGEDVGDDLVEDLAEDTLMRKLEIIQVQLRNFRMSGRNILYHRIF